MPGVRSVGPRLVAPGSCHGARGADSNARGRAQDCAGEFAYFFILTMHLFFEFCYSLSFFSFFFLLSN